MGLFSETDHEHLAGIDVTMIRYGLRLAAEDERLVPEARKHAARLEEMVSRNALGWVYEK